jgi:excisionase family DNA binding protein
MERVTIAEAAKQLGVTQEAIRQRIRRGTIESHKDEGKTYVYIDEAPKVEPPVSPNTELLDVLRSQIASLESDKEALREEALRKDQIIANLIHKVPEPQEQQPQLEAPAEEKEPWTLRGFLKQARLRF